MPYLRDALRTTLFSELSRDQVTDALADETVTAFNGVAVRGGEKYAVIGATKEAAEKDFPKLPTLDADAVVASLKKNLQAQCTGSGGNHSCRAPRSDTRIGDVAGAGSPVTLSAEVDVTTRGTWFENVPEYLEAAGLALSEKSRKVLADCDPDAGCHHPVLITDDGLLVEVTPNFQMTMVTVQGLPTWD